MISGMDQVVEIFTTSYTIDDMGGRERTIVSGGQYFAQVKHLGGSEGEHADRDAYKVPVDFLMHNFEGFPVGTIDFIDWNGKRFNVNDVAYDGPQRLYVTFKATAGDSYESTNG